LQPTSELFENHEDYYTQCTNFRDKLSGEYQKLRTNYHSFNLGGYGWALLSATIVFLVWFFWFILADKKFGKLSKNKVSTIATWVFVALGALWGLWFVPAVSVLWKLIGGIIIGLIAKAGLDKALIWIKHDYFNVPRSGTPLSKLKIHSEYIDFLETQDVYSVEDLVDADISKLAEDSGLLVETLIEFRVKGEKVLSQSKKKRRS